MKQRIIALRYLLGAFAVSAALSLVCLAQAASGASGGGQGQGSQQAAPAIEWPVDPISMMVAEWTRAKNWTKEYLDKMPEEGLNLKPTPDVRSFAEQMIHLAGANFAYAARSAGQPNPYQGKDLMKMDEFKTKTGLTKLVMESYDFMLNGLKTMNADKLKEKIQRPGITLTREAIIHNGFEHQTHHRGQTTIYLRLKGVTPPPEPFQ